MPPAIRRLRSVPPAWIAAVVLLIAFAAYYWQVIFGGRLVSASDLLYARYLPFALGAPSGFTPSNPALTDSVVSLAPAMTFVRDSLSSGQLPLWNPYTEFGMPFFAQSQWGLLSPLQAPFLVPGSVYTIYTAQTLVGMLKIAVAGSGGYLLGRRLALTRAAAVFAALAWALGGYTTAWLSMPASAVTVLLPWICVAFEQVLRGARPWLAAAGLALVMACTVAGGHPEALVYTFAAAAIYAITRMVQERASLRTEWRPRLGATAAAVVLAVGMSAVILIPAVELLRHSVDSSLRAVEEKPTFMTWNSLLQVFLPSHFGGPAARGPFYSAFAAPWYAGAVTAVAAILALVLRDRRITPFALMAVATVVIGMNTWPWRQIEDAVQLLGAMPKSAPLVMWAFALSFGGAIGVDRLGRSVATWTSRPWVSQAVPAALGVVLFVELYHWGHNYNPRVPRSTVAVAQPSALAGLPKGGGAPRTLFLGHTLPFLLPMGYRQPEVRSYGQPTRSNYDGFMRIVVTNLAGVLNPSEIGYPVTNVRPNTIQALAAANTRYVAFSDGEWNLKGLKQVAGGALNVFENPRALPRAFVASSYVVEPSENRALARVADPHFDPLQQVVVDRAPPGVSAAPVPATASAQITRYRNDHVDLHASADHPALVVLSDSQYPGWQAHVDGKSAHIYKVDGLFRGVAIPAGRHTVSFDFHPRSIEIGALISLVSLLLTGCLALFGGRRSLGRHGG
jgi:hypothetical protein